MNSMRRILTILAFIGLAFIFVTKPSYAIDLSDCIVSEDTSWTCDNFIKNIRSCIAGETTKGKLPGTVFNPETYRCVDSNGTVDMQKCKANFASYVCKNADPRWGGAGSCSGADFFGGGEFEQGTGSCGDPYLTSGSYFDEFGNLFEENYKNYQEELGITPTPIPVPTDGVPTAEICFERAKNLKFPELNAACNDGDRNTPCEGPLGGTCGYALDDIRSCFNEILRNNRFSEFDGYIDDLDRAEGAKFLDDIQKAYQENEITARCINEPGASGSGVDFDAEIDDKFSDILPRAQQKESAIEAGASSEILEGNLALDLEQLYGENAECGVDGGPGTIGHMCCAHNTDIILPENAKLRMPASAVNADEDDGGGFLQDVWDAVTSPFSQIYTSLKDAIVQNTAQYIDIDSKYYCETGQVDKTYSEDGSKVEDCQCLGPSSAISKLCNSIGQKNVDSIEREMQCKTCVLPPNEIVPGTDIRGKGGYWTAIGCIDSNLEGFIQNTIFGWGLGLAGITALLCVIYASFQLQMSANNPEQIKGAQELLTSCITGLIVIIFSVVILRIIGVDLLRIPGLSG